MSKGNRAGGPPGVLRPSSPSGLTSLWVGLRGLFGIFWDWIRRDKRAWVVCQNPVCFRRVKKWYGVELKLQRESVILGQCPYCGAINTQGSQKEAQKSGLWSSIRSSSGKARRLVESPEMFSGQILDNFFKHVKRALNQEGADDVARILLALVSDHPSRRSIAERLMDWEELMHDSELGILTDSRSSISRKEGEAKLKAFVRSVISGVWKP